MTTVQITRNSLQVLLGSGEPLIDDLAIVMEHCRLQRSPLANAES